MYSQEHLLSPRTAIVEEVVFLPRKQIITGRHGTDCLDFITVGVCKYLLKGTLEIQCYVMVRITIS